MKPAIPVAAKMSISSRTRSKLKRKKSITQWSNLPAEIHGEILLSLPAKSILVSRCVCKHFRNLLSEPSFIKNHVNRTIQSNTSPKLLISDSSHGKHLMIYSVGIDYASISPYGYTCVFRGAVPINYPFESNKSHSLAFLGSCNGLVCLKIFRAHRFYFGILNPLTGEFKEFRTPRRGYWFSCGFGYDSNIDDYKLVAIMDNVGTGCTNIDVYTMKSNSWSSIPVTISYIIDCTYKQSRGVFLNGVLHWLGSKTTQKNSSQVIVCFDISNEVMLDMPLPEDVMPPKDYPGEVYKSVGVLGDCICVAFVWEFARMDVWVMQEYGVKESWVNSFTTTKLRWPSSNPFWKPLFCYDNRVILVDTNGEQLCLFDPTTERVRLAIVHDIAMAVSTRESYVETIVPLNSGTYLEKRITGGTANAKRAKLKRYA